MLRTLFLLIPLASACTVEELAVDSSHHEAIGDVCQFTDPWRPGSIIPVVYHPDTPASMGVSVTSFETTLRAALDEFYDNTGANIRFRLEGVCDSPGTCCTQAPETCAVDPRPLPAGKVLIYELPGNSNSWASAWDDTEDGYSDTGYVELGSDDGWKSFPGSTSSATALHGLLLHELMHVLSFRHNHECDETAVRASVTSGSRNVHLEAIDIDQILTVYGVRPSKGELWYENSQSPLNWIQGPSLVSPANLNRLATCDNRPNSRIPVAFTDATTRAVKVRSYGHSSGWGPSTAVPDVESHTHPAIACVNQSSMRLFFVEADSIQAQKWVMYTDSADGGATWGLPVLADSATTGDNSGVDATYDPASGLYIYTYRDFDQNVRTKVLSPGSSLQNHGYKASDAVSIACGSPAVVGTYNCILSWPDTDWVRTTRYVHARVITTGGTHQIETLGLRTAGPSFGTPYVAYTGPGSYPWRMVTHTGGRAYTFRKSASTTASWTSPQTLFDDGVVTPVVGSIGGKWGTTQRVALTTTPSLELVAPGCEYAALPSQFFGGPSNMSGCAGTTTWADRDLLCAPGYSACSASEWRADRDGEAPDHNYWTSDNLRYGGSSGACWVDTNSGNPCNNPMRVCVPGGTDDLGNRCNWSNCGWETANPNEYFGGCYNNSLAGTLCCRD